MTDFLTYLTNLFAFDSSHPLLFTQFHFWAFFFIVYFGFCLIVSTTRHPRRMGKARRLWRNGYLFLVSLFFYYKTSGNYVALLIFSTIVGYFLGLRFDHLANRQAATGRSTQRRRKTLMVLGVAVNLGVLCYFKYAYFFTDIFNTIASTHYSIANAIFLPVGISFFTFQNFFLLLAKTLNGRLAARQAIFPSQAGRACLLSKRTNQTERSRFIAPRRSS